MCRRRLLAALLPVLVVGSTLPGHVLAQAADDLDAVTFTLEPSAGSAVSGLAVLSPQDGDTAANVLAVGAPAGATAVIHAGTCAGIDPVPAGLLGDVGTTGQLAATVPVPFPVIADGTHVLALHPGLDLTTTLACGAIPAAARSASSAAPRASADPARGFRSPTFGFAIDWDAPWQRRDWAPLEGREGLSLSDGTVTVNIVGTALPGGDATACVRDWEGRLLSLLRDGTISDLVPVPDAQGQPVGGGDAQRAVGAYRYRLVTQADPQGRDLIEQEECRRLSDSAVLEITAAIPPDAQATAGPVIEALVARIRVEAPVVTPTGPPATAAPTPQPTAVPTAAPTPEPTVDAACAGMDTWVADTLARFDAVRRFGDDVTTAMGAGMAAYAQTLADTSVAIQRLQIEQQEGAVPATAADAQDDVIKMLAKLAEAYDLMAQAYTSGNSGVLQQGLSAASEAQGLATTARSSVRRVATPCGIAVPAV